MAHKVKMQPPHENEGEFVCRKGHDSINIQILHVMCELYAPILFAESMHMLLGKLEIILLQNSSIINIFVNYVCTAYTLFLSI